SPRRRRAHPQPRRRSRDEHRHRRRGESGVKLAAALRGRAPERILHSYEPERIGFARRLIATTDRVFQFVTRSGRLAARVRIHVAPRVISALFRLPAMRPFMFRTVSPTAIEYRQSELSEGRAGRIQGGDRLPWIDSAPD